MMAPPRIMSSLENNFTREKSGYLEKRVFHENNVSAKEYVPREIHDSPVKNNFPQNITFPLKIISKFKLHFP